MFIKIHKSYRNIVAICDSDLIGKRFEEGKFQLHLKENFYKGEEKEVEELIELIRKQSAFDATFNVVGKESIHAAIEAGVISQNDVSELAGIPYALTLL